MTNRSKTILVTGSTGLLGNNVVRQLLAAGHRVIGLTRSLEKGQWMLGDTGAELVVGDMRDVAGFADHLEGCDAVVHAAAYFREYYAKGDHAEALEAINIRGTLELMGEADRRGVRHFIQISSSGAVGNNADGTPGTEDTPPSETQLRNLYFRSKYEGDAKIREFRSRHGMSLSQVLPGWMWGPGDAGPTGAGQLALDFLAGNVPGVPKGAVNVVDARDVAQAIVTLVGHEPALSGEQGPERYIVAGEQYRLHQLLTIAAELRDRRPPMQLPAWFALAYAHASEFWARLTNGQAAAPVEGVRVFVQSHAVSSAKAMAKLGVEFRPMEETVRDVLDWYDAHGTWADHRAKQVA